LIWVWDFGFGGLLNFATITNTVSLTPGFSPVMAGKEDQNRFNGFSRAGKPLKRLARRSTFTTRLKPGVNESHWRITHFYVVFSSAKTVRFTFFESVRFRSPRARQ
jgi:hypothetical protein